MSADVFEKYSAYYDLLYGDKDYDGETAYIMQVLRSTSQPVRRILELGSGTGKHGHRLAQKGFEVMGIERSPGMVAAARAGAANITGPGRFQCEIGDVRLSVAEGSFDAVLALFHVVSYLTGNDDVSRTFANAAQHLRPGGVFIFDVWHGPAVLTQQPTVRVKRVENTATRLVRIAEPELDANASVVTVRYTILAESTGGEERVTFGEEHRMRYFFPTEIVRFAAEAGFELVRSEEFLSGRPPSLDTWGVAYTLRKRG